MKAWIKLIRYSVYRY